MLCIYNAGNIIINDVAHNNYSYREYRCCTKRPIVEIDLHGKTVKQIDAILHYVDW